MTRGVWIAGITILYVIFMRAAGLQFLADFNYASAQRHLGLGEHSRALELAQRAISQNPNEPRYFYGEAKVLLAQLPNASKAEILDLLAAAENVSPKNLVTLRNVAPFYYFLAVGNLQKPGGAENIDEHFLSIAVEFFEKLSVDYPDDAGVQVLAAKYEKLLGQEELYLDKIEKLRLLRPDLLEWHPDLLQPLY